MAGYRSLRDLTLALGRLNIVTGPNGSGKSSLYRSLRLLSEAAQGRLISSLAMEGGFPSTLWAGPEKIGRDMRSGKYPVQGTRRSEPVSLRLGFSGDAFGYAVDLGLPAAGMGFGNDPEFKVEAMWSGELLGRSNLFAERRNSMTRLRQISTGAWRESFDRLSPFDSMVTHCADPEDGLELLLMRERMRSWRFYDNLRTDQEAPARRPQIATYTPVLGSDGFDLASAIGTILAVGDGASLADAVSDAFPGSRVALDRDRYISIEMHQKGMLRPLGASELSEGTLRYLLLVAALLSPRPPELMILNEPESSLHPSLLDALGRLIRKAAETCQIIVVTHSERLVAALQEDDDAAEFVLEKDFGETKVRDSFAPKWVWPKR